MKSQLVLGTRRSIRLISIEQSSICCTPGYYLRESTHTRKLLIGRVMHVSHVWTEKPTVTSASNEAYIDQKWWGLLQTLRRLIKVSRNDDNDRTQRESDRQTEKTRMREYVRESVPKLCMNEFVYCIAKRPYAPLFPFSLYVSLLHTRSVRNETGAAQWRRQRGLFVEGDKDEV